MARKALGVSGQGRHFRGTCTCSSNNPLSPKHPPLLLGQKEPPGWPQAGSPPRSGSQRLRWLYPCREGAPEVRSGNLLGTSPV